MTGSDLDGLRLIVTGGASGIGLAVAQTALARGAAVAVLDLDPTTAPSGSIALTADVSDDVSVDTAVGHAATTMGGIDVVVNNAGIGAHGTVEDNSIDEWRHVFDVNVFGIVRVTRAALPHLRQSKCPAIVNTCSIAATAGLPRARPVQRDQRRGVVADVGDGSRPCVRRHSRQLCQSGHGGHTVGRPSAGRGR